MSTKVKNEWQVLAQHEQWLIEYRPDSHIVRVQLGDSVMYLEREEYQLLWGTITEGLDEIERVEDNLARVISQKQAIQPEIAWSQTRH